MVKTCIVKNCASNIRKKCENAETKSFFRFPTKLEDYKRWVEAVLCLNQQVLSKNIGKYSVMCSEHFSEDQLKPKIKGYALRKGAVPNIFPNYSHECTHVEYLESSFFEDPLDVLNNEINEDPIGVINQISNVLNEKPFEEPMTTNNRNESNVNIRDEGDSLSMHCGQFSCDRCSLLNVITLKESSNNLKITPTHIDKEKSLDCVEAQDRTNISVTYFSDQSTRAAKRSLADEFDDVAPNAPSTPALNPKKKRRICYAGDVQENCDLSPQSSQKYISILRKEILQQRMKVKQISQQNRRKSKKIASLKMVLQDLKDKGLISENAENMLKLRTTDDLSLMDKIRRGKVQNKYPPDVRAFALTLNFYSPQAYRYVRKTYSNKLPNPRTIRKWLESVDGSPGLTKEALLALNIKKKDLASKGIQLKLCLSFDGMSIRKQVEFNVHKKKYFGYVDFGGMETEREGDAIAKEAWVVLLTAINAHFKIPVGYFLVNGLTAKEKADIIVNTLRSLHEYEIEVNAIVYDGDAANVAMINELNPTTLEPTYFFHPSTNQKIHVIVDICHMLKLIRNTLASKKVFIDENGGMVEWKYIQMLHELQEGMLTRLGNKLSKRHVYFYRQKMKVKLAAQTLSRSVADALKTLKDINPEFKGCGPLIDFITIFDALFDICNSKSKFGKFYKRPLCPESEVDFLAHFDKSTRYINGLKLIDKQRIVDSRNRTGFKGFVNGIVSIRNIYAELCKNGPLEYLLTYKLSQDHLETFFGTIRSRGGFNNNPNAIQFMSAYKQLIVHNEVESSTNGNCIPLDGTNVLTISSSKILHRNEDEDDSSILSKDYGKVCPNFGTLALSEAIIYIAGFVQRAITRKLSCDDCLVALNARKYMGGTLLRNKNYGKHGGLCDPKQDIVVLCRIAERNLQAASINLHQPNIHQFLLTKCMREVPPKLLDNMEDHVRDCDPLENHRYLLIKSIIQEYLKVKLCHLGKLKTMTIQNSFIRSQNTKLILFSGQ